MRISPEITGASLVLLGNFNPSIFTPAWFGWRGLLPEQTADAAELTVAQPQITSFKVDWLEFRAVPDRFSLSSTQEPFIRLRDLGVRIFTEQLPHTPLHSLGINRQVHFLVATLEDRDRIGRQLAPVKPWGKWAEALEPDGRHGGMTSLTMTQVDIAGRPPGGLINATVQPSTRFGNDRAGVFVEINDHYVVADKTATAELMDLLESNFEDSLARAEDVIDTVMSLQEH